MGKRKSKAKSKANGQDKIRNADYTVYTDGGCDHNPGGRGGYGIVIRDNRSGDVTQKSGSYYPTTNNRMEMMAVIHALETLPKGFSVNLYSDSQYVINTLNLGWRKNKNRDLWDRLSRAEKGLTIKYLWVKGHNGNPDNERCDELATEAILNIIPGKDVGYLGNGDKAVLNQSKSRRHTQSKDTAPVSSMDAHIDVPTGLEREQKSYDKDELIARGLNPNGAKSLIKFWRQGSRKFSDYMDLKSGGLDSFSAYRKDRLIEIVGEETWDVVSMYIKDEKRIVCVLRWNMRGLSLTDAIRHELVSMEVEYNCAKRNKWHGK